MDEKINKNISNLREFECKVDASNKIKYSCGYCDLKFPRKDRLDRHLFSHTGIRAFKCDFMDCDKSYTNSSHLKRHVKSCHSTIPKNSYICEYPNCSQEFTNFSNMNRHYKNMHYTTSLPLTCDSCGMSFRRKNQLSKHNMFYHNIGNFKYSCIKCQKGFFNKIMFTKHIKTHENKVCNDCQKPFDNWSQLVNHRKEMHKRTNDEKKNKQCDLCGKVFCKKAQIREHINVHMIHEVLVYPCHYDNCSKFYSARRNLNAHIRSKHEGKKFMCTICKLKLSTNQKLQLHIKAAHDDPTKSKGTKKSNIAIILGISLHENTQNELFRKVNTQRIMEGISTESEFSDNN